MRFGRKNPFSHFRWRISKGIQTMHLVPIALRFNSGSNPHIVTRKIPKIPSLCRFPTLTYDVIGMTSSIKKATI